MSDNEKKPVKWTKHIFLYVVEALVLIVAVVGLSFVIKATKMQKVNIDKSEIAVNDTSSVTISDNELTKDDPEVQDPEASQTPEPEVVADKDAAEKALLEKYDGLFNVAFFGVDSREGELDAGTRSDSIMICSIDMKTHEVKLVSIFRDTYLNCGNDTYNKCNSAYAYGGPKQALSMINMNTDLYITDYITIGFQGLIDAIDALGGIDIEIKDDEVEYLNNYAMTMASELDIPYTEVTEPGLQTLNGLQATAYCRIRYTAGSDFKRAERQRDVLTAMLEKSRTVSFATLTSAVTLVLPNVSTSLNVEDFINMVSVASDYKVTVSDGFPFDGMRNGGTIGSKGSCVVPIDLTKNVRKLHELLFGIENYEPSDDIKRYSEKIKQDTAEYLQY